MTRPSTDLATDMVSGEMLPLENANKAPASPATEAWYSLRLSAYLSEKLDAGSLDVLETIEMPLVPVLADMERTGIALDVDYLKNLSGKITEVINQRRERVALLRTTFFRYNVLRAEPVTRGSTRGRGPASAHDAGSSPA